MKNEIYIGDNYLILTSDIFKRYEKKIKMIYIDPPYNTKNIKSYNDNICSDKWIDFICKRIEASKYLLKDDGCIFISIDDNEYSNLKIVCDKIFGKDNFIGTFITKQSQRSNAKHINVTHEYILSYAKNKKKVDKFEISRMENPSDKKMINNTIKTVKDTLQNDGFDMANKKLKELIKDYCLQTNTTWLRNYNNIDENGDIFFAVDLSTPSQPRHVEIDEINLKLKPLSSRGWVSDKKFIELFNKNRLCFKNNRPYAKHFLYEAKDSVSSILNFYSRQGTNDLKKLGIEGVFDTPKPVELLKFLIKISTKQDDIVLDFFAGSGTFAQATYEINDEYAKNIKYILIQSKEKINKNTLVYKNCIKHNINPSVDEIMLYRVKTYLQQTNKQEDFYLYNLD